jgi:hypothetical protein
MFPLAPTLLSTMTGTFNTLLRPWPKIRATTSLVVPAAKGEIIVIVLLGHCSAAAFDCAKADRLAQAAMSSSHVVIDLVNKFFIKFSIFFRCMDAQQVSVTYSSKGGVINLSI